MGDIGKVAGWLGAAFGAASIFMLIQQGLNLGLAAPLELVFSYYDATIKFFIGPLEPLFCAILGVLNSAFEMDYRLRFDWKHTFVGFATVTAAILRAGPNWIPIDSMYDTVHGPLLRLWAHRLLVAIVVASGLLNMATPRDILEKWFNLSNPPLADIPFAEINMCVLLTALGSWLLWRTPQSERRAAAWRLMSVPLGVLFLLFTNAGLRLIPGL